METNSTQAVEADTTLNATPVKRWKRGDVREDGMVFWCYQKGKERWVSEPEFSRRKQAHRIIDRRFKAKDSEALAEKRREEYAKNPRKFRATAKKWRSANREKVLAMYKKHDAKRAEQRKAYRVKTRARAAELARERRKRDPLACMKHRARTRLCHALRRLNLGKAFSTVCYLHCSWEKLKERIEAQFLPGMGWHNRHLWHIDHIVPLDFADVCDDLHAGILALSHVTNLRPMWKGDNWAKSSKLPGEHELPADLHDEVRKIWQRAKDLSCVA